MNTAVESVLHRWFPKGVSKHPVSRCAMGFCYNHGLLLQYTTIQQALDESLIYYVSPWAQTVQKPQLQLIPTCE